MRKLLLWFYYVESRRSLLRSLHFPTAFSIDFPQRMIEAPRKVSSDSQARLKPSSNQLIFGEENGS